MVKKTILFWDHMWSQRTISQSSTIPGLLQNYKPGLAIIKGMREQLENNGWMGIDRFLVGQYKMYIS